jgi:hypothetical protein
VNPVAQELWGIATLSDEIENCRSHSWKLYRPCITLSPPVTGIYTVTNPGAIISTVPD